MPIIKRATYDFMPDLSWIDIAVNPVNCIGVMGAGLALAFKEKYPDMYKSYRAYCVEGKLTMGHLHIYFNESDRTAIVNLPTKNHYIDTSNLDDVELGVKTLVRYLEKYPKHTVALPMLGAGLGKLDQWKVYALFEKYLDPLPNAIFVCMRPDSFEKIPKYLVIAGSRKYTDYLKINIGVMFDAMAYFGTSKDDFEAFVSGGARGVDSVACGTGLPGDMEYNIAKSNGVKAIVCQADWERYNKNAGFVRNRTLLEVGTHFVLFQGSVSVGTRMMRDLIERHNRRADELIQQGIELPPTKQPKQLFVHNISDICQ